MAESITRWQKADVISKYLVGILIPIALFCAGQTIANAQREESTRAVQLDRVRNILPLLGSEKERERLLAVACISYWGKTHDAPDELVAALLNLATNDVSENVSTAATKVVADVAKDTQSPLSIDAQKIFGEIPTRVFVHVAHDEQRALVARTQPDLAQIGTVANEVELVPDAPKQTEVRYFRPEDRQKADEAVEALKKQNVKAEVVDLSNRYRAPPKTIEVWMGR